MVFAGLVAALVLGVVAVSAVGQATWRVTIIGPHGGHAVYKVSADTANGAEDAAWAEHRARFTTSAVPTTTPPASGYPSLIGNEIDFDGGFDGCSLVGGKGGWGNNVTDSDRPGSVTIERIIVAEGQCSARFSNPAGKGRSELAKDPGGPDPHVVYEMLVYLPSSTSHAGAITQHKLSTEFGGDCFNGGLSNRDDDPNRLHLVAVPRCTSPQSDGQVRFVLGSIPRDRWFAVKVHERFSNDPSVGFVQAWIDTDGPGPNDYVERLPRTDVDNESGNKDGARVKFRIGTYSKGPTPRTIFIDGFHMDCIGNC
jgi:hypothetical protein